jgi:hypothetical protein
MPGRRGEIFYRQIYDLRIAVPAFLIYLALCFGVLRARHRAANAAREVPVRAAVPARTSNPAEERGGA